MKKWKKARSNLGHHWRTRWTPTMFFSAKPKFTLHKPNAHTTNIKLIINIILKPNLRSILSNNHHMQKSTNKPKTETLMWKHFKCTINTQSSSIQSWRRTIRFVCKEINMKKGSPELLNSDKILVVTKLPQVCVDPPLFI